MHAAIARAVLFPLAVGLALSASAASAEEKRLERTVTVSASGEVSAEPDMARISGGVVTGGDTARDALSRNSEAMKKLIAGLKSSGIEAKDIQTSSFRIDPRYTNPREGQAPVINGYQVTNQVAITARDLDRLGEVLDALVSLGANQMNGLSFEVSKAETLKDEARKEAIANALRRAKLYAAAAGAEVGEVVAISEDTASVGPYPMPMARSMKAEAVPIERGTETLEARVTVTWALK
jgi:hypothetical protein